MSIKHWVVMFDWAVDNGMISSGIDVIAVEHSIKKAKKILAEHIEDERRYADEHEYIIHTDTDTEFDAGKPGYYSAEHTRCYIVGVS